MTDDVPDEPGGWSETEVYHKELEAEHIEQLRKHGELVIQWDGLGDSPEGLDGYTVEARLTVPETDGGNDHRVDEVLE